MTQEEIRLSGIRSTRKHWKRWGPYLSERAWGTVREDYSPYGNAWEYLSHDQARIRAYRWNEDGLAGISRPAPDHLFRPGPVERARSDPERTDLRPDRQRGQSRRGREGVLLLPRLHTDALLHEVPVQVSRRAEFPYGQLVEENRRRGKNQPEFELIDTGVFNDDRYFDVFVEYAKADTEDILIKITVANRGPEAAELAPAADGLVPQHLVLG